MKDRRLVIFILAFLASAVSITSTFGAAKVRKTLLRDGFALGGVDGKLVGDSKADRWLFELSSDVRDDKGLAKAGTRLELLRSAVLEKMTADANGQSDTSCRLWGRVTKYKGENYIYPIYFVPMGRIAEPNNTAGKEPKKQQTRPVMDDPNDPLTIPKELREKLQTRRVVRPEQLKKGMELKLDSILADRAGFIKQEGDAEWQWGKPDLGTGGQLVFVPDALGRSIQGVRLRLLFCDTLERAERKLSASPDPLRFKVAGIVTQYKGENYLLLQRAVRVYTHGNFD